MEKQDDSNITTNKTEVEQPIAVPVPKQPEVEPEPSIPVPLPPKPQNSINNSYINPDSLPSITPVTPPKIQLKSEDIKSALKPQNSNKARTILLFIFMVIIICAGAGGSYLYYIKQKTTSYTLLPEDSQFYLSLSVKKHPQVQQMLELGKRFPGGEKMIKYLDDNRSELFGQRKDPFKEILDLADDEIFLAKISSDETQTEQWRSNPLEKLVNIVTFKNGGVAKNAMKSLSSNENIIAVNEAYGSAKITKLELKKQSEDEKTKTYDTGALPYMVTLPLSKNIYATQINKFIASAEKKNDVQKILDLVHKKKDKKLKSLAEDKEHNEVASHFPKETLVKFYQKQLLDPFSNSGVTSFPTTAFGGSRYDTTEREKSGDDVFEVKRGFTINTDKSGFDLTSYQLTDKSLISQGLKHGFSFEGSLANNIPAQLDGREIISWTEIKNIKQSLKDQEDNFWKITNNSSDKMQKETYADVLDSINKAKKSFKEEFGLDVDEDLLAWMDKQSAFVTVSGTRDKAPEALAIFEVEDAQNVIDKISKIKIKDYVKVQTEYNKGRLILSKMKNDIGALATELQGYYTSPGKGQYPQNLESLVTSGALKALSKQQNGQDYGYLACANGKEAIVWGQDEINGKIWAWTSTKNRAGYIDTNLSPIVCNVTVNYSYDYEDQIEEIPYINPVISDYNGEKIYSYPIIDYKGDQFAFRFTKAGNLVLLSFGASDNSLKEIIDGKTENSIAKNEIWTSQFSGAPKFVGSIFYLVPKNIFGASEYFMNKEEQVKKYVMDDHITIARGYLKTIKSIGATTTQEESTLITNTHLTIEAIDPVEAKQIEEALDNVFFSKLDRNKRSAQPVINQSQDQKIKSDIHQLSTAIQAYYVAEGHQLYPVTLNELVTKGYLTKMPLTPSETNYPYFLCQNNKQAVVWTRLESEVGYWVYSTASGTQRLEATIPTIESCSKKVLGTKEPKANRETLESIFDNFKKNIKSAN